MTWSVTKLDLRGFPSALTLVNISDAAGATLRTIGEQTRNVAGLVTKRRTNVTTGMGYVESNWQYDKLGRVLDQTVQKGPGTTKVAEQTLTYFGNDDPKTLLHFLGTASKTFTYGFDLRHQLTGVTSSTSSYFGATYQFGNAGRLTRATETQTISPLPTGTEVKARNVNYVYGDADPERVTALTNVSGGARYATFTYDAAGNMTWKCSGATFSPTCTGESFNYIYDGKDQLRRATRKVNNVVQGSEEYWYDLDGQRIAIVKKSASGVKTEMVWFTKDTEAHYDGAGAVTHVYSNVSMGTPVARVDRTANNVTTLEMQFHGLASNTLAAVDQGGTVNATFSYAPFGEVIESGGTTAGATSHKRRFNDKFQDDLTALTYYGARFYDKTLIGWTQGDPMYRFAPDAAWSSPRRALCYAFTGNNPLRYLDPDGKDPLLEWAREDLHSLGVDLPQEGPIARAVDVGVSTVARMIPGVAVAETAVGAAASYFNPGTNGSGGMPANLDRGGPTNHGGDSAKTAGNSPGTGDKRLSKQAGSAPEQLSLEAPKERGSSTRSAAPAENGTFFVDPAGNAIPTPKGGSITGSKDGKYLQARDATGEQTGVRKDGGGHRDQNDPKAQAPHGHQPGVVDEQGNPHLPIKQ